MTEGDYDIVIDISNGGKKEEVLGFDSVDSDYQLDYEPNRCYMINTKSGLLESEDFYWE